MDIVSPLKQLGKYTAGAAWDTVRDYNDNVSTLAADAKEIRDNVIHAGKTSIEIFNDFRLNGMKKFNDWFWQNENELGEYDLNNPDDDFDAGFQINNGTTNDEDDNASTILDARAMKDITRGQVNAMYKISGKQVEAATMNTAEIVSTINSRSSEIIASVNNVNTSLAKISKQLDFITSNMSTAPKEEKQSRGMIDSITDHEGKLTLGNVVKETMKELSQYTDMFGMIKDFGSMLGPRELIHTGFNYLAEHKFDKLGGKSIADYMEKFNESFGNKVDEILSNLLNTDFVRNNTSLGQTYGNNSFRSSIKNNYNTDLAKFDGITRQTIIEIIPGYLKSINAALTGQQLEINTKGHLTTGKVDAFANVASILMRSDGMTYEKSGQIASRINTLNADYNQTDVRDAGRALSGIYAYMAYYHGWMYIPDDYIHAYSADAIDKAADQLARTNKRRTREQWHEILIDVSMQLFSDNNARRKFAQNAAQQCKDMIKRAEDIATNTTRPQDVRRITLDMVFDQYGTNNQRQTALDSVNDKYHDRFDELEDKLYDAQHKKFNPIEVTKIKTEINKLKNEMEKERREIEEKFSDNTNSSIMSSSAISNTPLQNTLKTTNSHLQVIQRYTESLYTLLNRGINVRTIGEQSIDLKIEAALKGVIKKTGQAMLNGVMNASGHISGSDPFPSKMPRISMQYFAQSREEPTTFEPQSSTNDPVVFTPRFRNTNNGRQSNTSAGSSTSSNEGSSDDDAEGDRSLRAFGGYLKDQASQAYNSIKNNETVSNLINKLSDTKIGSSIKGFVDEHRPKNNDGTALTLDASDKNYFDFIRTSISAALSNGNGVEDMGNIQRLIQKVKNPQLRQFLQREVDKILKLNSKKVDAENERDTDPNMPPEKKPGVLGGIAQLFLGKAKSIFAPITMLLKPITSLVNVIAKPLIELAKKGFKSGASDIKAGAKQIWSVMKPKGLPFGKKKDGTTAKSEDYVNVEVDVNGNISQKNKTTADAGAAAGVKQPQDKMYPLAPATQTYATNAMSATTGVTTTNNSTGWSGAQSFQFGNSMPIQGGSMQQQQKTVDAKNTGWSGGSYNYQLIQNAPQITTSNKPMSVEKTTANDGAAAGVNNESDTTKENTKATGKLANVMGGLGKIGLGLVKIIGTVLLSLTAVKTAIDLVMRVLTRSLQPLNKGINKLMKSLRPVIKSLGRLVSQLSNFVNTLIDSLMGIIQPLMDILTPVLDAIMVALEPLMQSIDLIVDVVVKTLEPLMPMVQIILDNVTTSLNMVTNFINEIITPFTESIQPIIEEFGEIFEPMLKNLQETLEPIRDMISDVAIGVIGPWFADFTSKLVPAIQDISSIFKFFVGKFEIGLGTVENLGGFVVSAFGKLISLLVDDQFGDKMVQAGQKMQESGQQTTKSGQQNVSDALLYWLRRLKIYDAPVEEKKEVDIPEPSPIKSNQTYHGSVMDGLTGSGDPHDQHSYGGFLNMSDHGCGPIALADMAARRNGGVVNAANLALSMAGSGAYSVNSGTSIGSFMDTAASMGMGTQLGGVSAASLGLASPSNPITLIGSGYGFGTRHGNNHYVNVIGTDGNGGAYVSNPLNGRIEVHSASGLASSALAGIYGSGDVGSTTDQIHDLRNATSALTEIGSSTGNTTGIDLGSAVEDAMYDLKQLTSKLLGIFNFDGTFEDKLNKSISDKTQQSLADRYESSMTDEEYNAYVEKARALFKQENPKKLFESDKRYEQRFQENLGTYLAKVAGDATKAKKADLMNYSLTTQTNNIEAMYGKYDPESDSYIDEDNGSIVSMVSDVVNSKVGTGFLQTMLKLGGNMVKGLMNMTGIGGLAGTVAGAISNIGDVISQNNGNGVDYTTSETGGNGGTGGTNNAVNDPNNKGSMVSSGGVKLGGAGYTPSITTANVQGNSSSTMTQTPIHEYLAYMAGQPYAWSVDGNWFSKRNTPDRSGQGSTSSSHGGVDILMPDRTSNSVRLYATTDGVVIDTRSGVTGQDHTNHTAGNAVYWKDNAGYKHRFLHLANTTPMVKSGDHIQAGQLLGYMGNTGDSYGHHLHYDISTPGGQNVNPMTYFQFSSGTTQNTSSYQGGGQITSGDKNKTNTSTTSSSYSSNATNNPKTSNTNMSSGLSSTFQDLKNRSKQKRENAKTAFGGGETAEYVWDYLTRGLGLTYEGAAGVMGNLQAESGLRPNNLEDIYEGLLGYTDESYTDAVDSGAYPRSKFISDHKKANCGAGYGLPQFTWHTLKGTLYDKAKAKGVSISDVGVQMETVFETAGETLLNLLKTTTDIKTATERWLRDYEKPANIESALNTRYANAQKIYDQYRYKLSSYYDNAGNPGGYETFNKDGHYDESMSDLLNYLNLVGVVGDNSGSSYSSGCDGYCSPYDSYEPTYSSSGGYSNYSPSYSSSGGGGYSSKVSSGGGSSSTTSKPSTSSSPTSGKTIASLPGVKSANARPSSVSEKYTNSGLVKDGMDYSSQFVAKTGDRTRDIDTVTWHVWAGGGDMKSFMPNMTSSARSMSPTYAIDSYGNIAQFADEGRRPWTSGDSQNKSNTNGWKNDNRSITFEIANVPGVSDKNKYANGYNEQYPITPESMQSALDLTVDVARRNGINYFYYTGNQFYGNKYAGDTGVYASPGNFTYHNQFAQKACPGEYIMSQTNNIVKTLNERISMGRGAAIAGLDQKTIEQAYTGDVSMLDKSTQALIDKYTMKRYATDMWQAQSYAAHNNMVAQAEKKMLKDLGIDSKTAYAPSNYTSTASTKTTNASSYSVPQSIVDWLSPSTGGDSDTEKKMVYSYLITEMGMSPEAAAGIMGNLKAESEIHAGNLQNSYNKRFGLTDEQYTQMVDSGQISRNQFINDSAGYGLAQFTYSGWKEMLYDVAKERGTSIGDTMTQLVALKKMLSEKMPALYSTLQNTTSIQTAADLFLEKYENPEVYNYSTRRKNANALYNELGNWLPTSIYGTPGTSASTGAYSDLVNYYLTLMSGDSSYMSQVDNDLNLYNDLIRYGQYFYNAGGGQTDYSWVNEVQALSDMYGQTDYPDGWIFENQSFGLYYENGIPIGQVSRDQHGAWSPIFWSQPTRTKPADTGNKGGAPATSSGDSTDTPQKSTESLLTNSSSTNKYLTQQELKVLEDAAKNKNSHILHKPTSITDAINMIETATTTAKTNASDIWSKVKPTSSSWLVNAFISSLIPNKAALAGLGAAGLSTAAIAAGTYGATYGADYLAMNNPLSTYLGDVIVDWAQSTPTPTQKQIKSNNTITDYEYANTLLAYDRNGNLKTNLTRDYINKYGSLNAPITSYEQAQEYYGVLGSKNIQQAREAQFEKNRQQVLTTQNAYYAALEKNAQTQKAIKGQKEYQEAKTRYDFLANYFNKKGGKIDWSNKNDAIYAQEMTNLESILAKNAQYANYYKPDHTNMALLYDGTWINRDGRDTDYWSNYAFQTRKQFLSNWNLSQHAKEQQRMNDLLRGNDNRSMGSDYWNASIAQITAAQARSDQKRRLRDEYDRNMIGRILQGDKVSTTYVDENTGKVSILHWDSVADYLNGTPSSINIPVGQNPYGMYGSQYSLASIGMDEASRKQRIWSEGVTGDSHRITYNMSGQDIARAQKTSANYSNLIQQALATYQSRLGRSLTSSEQMSIAYAVQNNGTQAIVNGYDRAQSRRKSLLASATLGATGSTGIDVSKSTSPYDHGMSARDMKIINYATNATNLSGQEMGRILGSLRITNPQTNSEIEHNKTLDRIWSSGVSDQWYDIKYATGGQDMARLYSSYNNSIINRNKLLDALDSYAKYGNLTDSEKASMAYMYTMGGSYTPQSYDAQSRLTTNTRSATAMHNAFELRDYVTTWQKAHNKTLSASELASLAIQFNTRSNSNIDRSKVSSWDDYNKGSSNAAYAHNLGYDSNTYVTSSSIDAAIAKGKQQGKQQGKQYTGSTTSSGIDWANYASDHGYNTTQSTPSPTAIANSKPRITTTTTTKTSKPKTTTTTPAKNIWEAQANAAKTRNGKVGHGDPDITPSTLTNVEIPSVDLNKLLTPDATTTTAVKSTYTSYNKSNDALNKILTNTYNVRAKRVEDLLESIDKKLESYTKKSNNGKQSTPTPTQQNLFPNNDIPTQIDKLAQG